jgi:ATP-dependent Clp protease adaptor protein ClpS
VSSQPAAPAVPEAATAAPAKAPARLPSPAPERVDHLPLFRVLLHNDDHNDMVYVVETLVELTPLNVHLATNVMLEAHNRGVALVLTTHQERAELYIDQLQSKRLTATMERAD